MSCFRISTVRGNVGVSSNKISYVVITFLISVFFKLTVWCVVCLQFVIKLKGCDNISYTCLVNIISAYCSSISVVAYGGESIVKVTKLISKKQQLNGLILSPQWNKLYWMVFTNVLLGCLCSLVCCKMIIAIKVWITWGGTECFDQKLDELPVNKPLFSICKLPKAKIIKWFIAKWRFL